MKSISTRLFIGFKKGFFTPTLPEKILAFQSYPLIRILRFLGGISILFILSKVYLKFHIYSLYIAIFFVTLFAVYHFVITYYRIKHMVKLLKSDALEIKNSPLDRLATIGAKLVLCLKGVCETTQPVGVALTLMLGTDEIFKHAGRQPVFGPILGDALNVLVTKKRSEQDFSDVINKNLDLIQKNKFEVQSLENVKAQLNKSQILGNLTKLEANDFISGINDHIKDVNANTDELKTKIQEQIEKLSKK